MKRFLVIFFVLVFVSSVYGACTPGQTTSTPCNAECDGIKIEDKCYDCGADDGVCPRDFGVNCDSYPDCDDCNIDKTKPECTGVAAGCTDCSFFDDTTCDSSSCNNIKCYWFKNTLLGIDLLAQNYCTYCISDMTCEDYEFQGACEKDNCAITNCEWNYTEGICETKEVTLDDTTCNSISECDDYTTYGGDICEDNPCEILDGNIEDLTAGSLIDGEKTCIFDLDETCSECYVCTVGEEQGCAADKEECDAAKGDEDASSCDCETEEGIAVCTEIGFTCPETIGGEGVITTTEQPSQPFPIFTWFNLIITSVIIIGFYVFYRKK